MIILNPTHKIQCQMQKANSTPPTLAACGWLHQASGNLPVSCAVTCKWLGKNCRNSQQQAHRTKNINNQKHNEIKCMQYWRLKMFERWFSSKNVLKEPDKCDKFSITNSCTSTFTYYQSCKQAYLLRFFDTGPDASFSDAAVCKSDSFSASTSLFLALS